MNDGKIFLSVRFWHPFLKVDEIISQIGRRPVTSQNVGEKFISPKGRIIDRLNKESYVVYDFPITSCDLVNAIRIANDFLFEIFDFVNNLKKTGGRSDYYLSIGIKDRFAFEFLPELFKDCFDLGITLGV